MLAEFTDINKSINQFHDDFDSDINVCNVNNVDSDHGDLIIVHLRCLCDFCLLRYEEDDPSAASSSHRYAAILLIGHRLYLVWFIYFRVFD